MNDENDNEDFKKQLEYGAWLIGQLRSAIYSLPAGIDMLDSEMWDRIEQFTDAWLSDDDEWEPPELIDND